MLTASMGKIVVGPMQYLQKKGSSFRLRTQKSREKFCVVKLTTAALNFNVVEMCSPTVLFPQTVFREQENI